MQSFTASYRTGEIPSASSVSDPTSWFMNAAPMREPNPPQAAYAPLQQQPPLPPPDYPPGESPSAGSHMLPEPSSRQEEGGADGESGGANSATHLLIKLVFYTCIALQVVLWPSVMTITFASAIALEGLINLVFIYSGVESGLSNRKKETLYGNLTQYSVLMLHNRRVTTGKYVLACVIGVYMLFFFMLFVSHEARVQPAQTTWLAPSVLGKYTFMDEHNDPIPGADATSSASGAMRENPFVWPRMLQRPAVIVNGTIAAGGGPGGRPLLCGAADSNYQCVSAKLAIFSTPSFLRAKDSMASAWSYMFVPFISQFYVADVIVSPPRGSPCAALEVYRITLDDRFNIEHGLDYPASNSANASQGASLLQSKCGVFGTPSWCLAFEHLFTDADYRATVATKCETADGQLVIRLPPRSPDVYSRTGGLGQDILVATAGATIQVRWTWHDQGLRVPLLTAWEQTSSAETDQAQPLRDASDTGSVFFKYAVAVLPLLFVWYFLAVSMHQIVEDYQVAMKCLFVLVPSALLFLTVGAWLPMAGCIICVIAINHTPYTHEEGGEKGSHYGQRVRVVLLFLTAACNSIQFVWLCVLIQQAGWTAFFYDDTLRQLAEKSNQFIIAGNPTWVGLLLPIVLLVNLAFLLGSAICVAMELLVWWRAPAGGSASSSSLSA